MPSGAVATQRAGQQSTPGRLRGMAAGHSGRYIGLNQTSGLPRPWWSRIPHPVASVAVKAWSLLPRVVRARFVPLGHWINPYQTTSAHLGSRPDIVAGVAGLRAQGFEPIEDYTGAVEVAHLWPDAHRRWVVETRPDWLDGAGADGRLWLVRSPWPALSLRDSLNVLWSWVERDHAPLDAELWRRRVSEALAWDEKTAADWRAKTTL